MAQEILLRGFKMEISASWDPLIPELNGIIGHPVHSPLFACALIHPQPGRKDPLMSSITHREDGADRAKKCPYKSLFCAEPASKRGG